MNYTTNRPTSDGPTRIAVISDVHSEPEALKSVLDAIDELGIERIWCLGDIVGGRGIDAVGVFDSVMERCEVVLAGNHDRIVAGQRELLWVETHEGIDRSRAELEAAGGGRLDTLAALPSTLDLDGPYGLRIGIAHGCTPPFDPVIDYVEESVPSHELLLARPELNLILVGHTHIPMSWDVEGPELHVNPGTYPVTTVGYSGFDHDTPLVINPGSVAPGRDGHTYPTWLELAIGPDRIDLTWHRSGEPAYDPALD